MKNALNNQVGMLGDMFLWLVANLKQGVIYFIKQALPPNISAGSVSPKWPPRILIFSIAMGADYSFDIKSGFSIAAAFSLHKNFDIASV